jgi:VWFA-related protein
MNRFHCRLPILGAIVVALSVGVGAQQQPVPQRATGTVQGGVSAVLVDVVVRDRKGDPVRDLSQDDFEILEDGTPQSIGSFTPIFEGGGDSAPATDDAVAASAGGKKAPADTPPGPGLQGPPVTALVFDRLSPEAKKIAVAAARKYVSQGSELPSLVGVFGIDLAFTPYAPFTKDPAVLSKALDTIESRASTSFGIDKERQADVQNEATMTANAADTATSGAGAGGTGGIGSAPGAAQLAAMESEMMRAFEVLERDEQGYASVNGLFAIIGQLKNLPGRKSIVLFSEGVSIPPAVQRLFLGVIDAANRANVSIYTMDAAGLRATSQQAEIRDAVNQSANVGLNANATVRNGAASRPLSERLEKNEDVLRQDAHTGLGMLAQETGGELFENTNNLRKGFDRVESDLRNYYLLGYTPTNGSYDGTFRKIEVKVKRSGVTVAARKGYFAVRNAGGGPVNTWEAPALGVLDRRPVPNNIPVRTGALIFPDKTHPGVVPVLVDLKTEPMSFPETDDKRGFKSDFAVVVRFLGSKDEVVRKVGQHYEMAADMDKLDLAKNSEVLFYREPELPPGVYTMQTIVYDHPSGKASVRYATVDVPKVDASKLRMSSFVIVKKAEKVRPDEPKDGPLFVNDVLVYPNLGSDVSKAAEKDLGFFFTVYPGTSKEPTIGALELLQNGKLLAQLPLQFGPPDAAGRIQELGRLPIAELPPGTYELRGVAKQGSEQVYKSAMVRIVE